MKMWERFPQASGTAVTREPKEAGDPHSSEETSGPQGSEESRTPEGSETRGQGETEETRGSEDKEGMESPKETEIRDPEETRENPRSPEESGEIRGPEENAETRDPGENERIRGPEETEEIEGPKETEIRGPKGSETTSGLEETEKIRGPEENKGIRGSRDTEETGDPGETRTPKETEGRDPEESKETRCSRETWSPKETEDRGPEGSEGNREPGDIEDNRGPKHTETKSLRETEETRGPGMTWSPEKAENRGPEDSGETRAPRETRTSKEIEVRDPNEPGGTGDPEESKETRTPKETEGYSPEGYTETRTTDNSKEIRTSGKRKLRGSVRFEIRELEETDSSETGGLEIPKESRNLEEVKAMAEKGCLSLTKYFLFVFNIFFFVLGSLVFCFGLWILIDKNSFASYLGISFVPLKVWSYVLAITGVLTTFLSFLGCLGALKEIRCLLGLYFSFLLLLFTTQITIGVLVYTQHGLLERKVKDIVLDIVENYHKYPDAYSTAENWDFVQFQLRCCGWTSPQDWLLASSLRSNSSAPSGSARASKASPTPSQSTGPGLRVPCSCQNTSVITSTPQSPADAPRASQPAAGSGARATVVSAPGIPVVLPGPGSPGTPARLRSGELCWIPADSGVYQEGCSRSIYTWLHNNLISIVGVSLGLGLLELGVMSLSMFLCRNLDHVYNKLSRYS